MLRQTSRDWARETESDMSWRADRLAVRRLLRPRMLGLLPDKGYRLAHTFALGGREGRVIERRLGLLKKRFHLLGENPNRARFVDKLLDLTDRGVVGGARA